MQFIKATMLPCSFITQIQTLLPLQKKKQDKIPPIVINSVDIFNWATITIIITIIIIIIIIIIIV